MSSRGHSKNEGTNAMDEGTDSMASRGHSMNESTDAITSRCNAMDEGFKEIEEGNR